MSSKRGSVRRNKVIQLSRTYTVTKRGDSKALCFLKALDPQPIPTELGTEYQVEFREEGPDGTREIALKPATDE